MKCKRDTSTSGQIIHDGVAFLIDAPSHIHAGFQLIQETPVALEPLLLVVDPGL